MRPSQSGEGGPPAASKPQFRHQTSAIVTDVFVGTAFQRSHQRLLKSERELVSTGAWDAWLDFLRLYVGDRRYRRGPA